jgi:outer membrane protein, heavy metal efflux system
MQKARWSSLLVLLCFAGTLDSVGQAPAPQSPNAKVWTWDQIKDRFQLDNPTLLADKLNIDESKAEEITAFLRPNPSFTVSVDGTQIAPNHGVWRPFAGTFVTPSFSYLHERRHKRELRLESQKNETRITEFSHDDLNRTLLFNLRSAFVSILQAKAVLQLAQADLTYWDKVLQISRDRYQAGDIAQIDLDRLELQRIQYESDVQTAIVNLRTAKIQLLTLLTSTTSTKISKLAMTSAKWPSTLAPI